MCRPRWCDITRRWVCCPSESVKRIAAHHVAELDQRIEELTTMKRSLQTLIDCCHGDQRPDCPILDELGQLHG